jgi:hypothetical protein
VRSALVFDNRESFRGCCEISVPTFRRLLWGIWSLHLECSANPTVSRKRIHQTQVLNNVTATGTNVYNIYLLNQIQTSLIVREFDSTPINLFFVVLILLQLENVMIEMLLKFLYSKNNIKQPDFGEISEKFHRHTIGVVYTKLLKGVGGKVFWNEREKGDHNWT